jgi:ABC-type multidrug transport system fused ATPase/permease subunit
MSILKKVSYLLSKKHKKELFILTLLLLVGVLFEMLSLGSLVPVITMVTDKVRLEQFKIFFGLKDFTYLESVFVIFISLLLIFILKTIFLIYLNVRQSNFSSTLYADLSNHLFKRYLSQPFEFHLSRNSSELLKNIQVEIDVFTLVSRSAMIMGSEIAFIVGIVLILIIFNPIATILVILFFSISAYVFHLATRKQILKWGLQRQDSDENSYKQLIQALGGIKEMILMNKKNYFLNKFNFYISKKARVVSYQSSLLLIPRLYLELLAIIAMTILVLILILQGYEIYGVLPVLAVFVASAFRLIPSFNKIMGTLQTFRYAKPVVNLLYTEFSKTKDAITSNNEGNLIFSKYISIENLNFRFKNSDRFSIRNVSFQIQKGMSIGLIGSSGSGKSTIADILMGVLAPNSGLITVDGSNINDNIFSWQKKIGYVSQSIFLLDSTLKENIAYAEDLCEINEERLWKALRLAQLENWVMNLPKKLETDVGERGVRLSGGQRQRIGLARALYNDPEILILDEATSSLDHSTERKIMESVRSLHGTKTILIIAHRLNTIQFCDYVYRIENGQIVESGPAGNFVLDSSTKN